MDDDLATKRIKTEGPASDMGRRSRLNGTHAVRLGLVSFTPDELPEVSSISRTHHRDDIATRVAHEKENIDPFHRLEGDLDEPPQAVHQEDGYMSPPASYFRLTTPDLSSPIGHPFRVTPGEHGSTDDFGADIISSPLATKRRSPWFHNRTMSPREGRRLGGILVRGTPPPIETDIGGPDLRDILSVCSADEIEELESHETSGARPSHEPETITIDATLSEDLGLGIRGRETRMHTVANGWWNKWAVKQEPRPAHVSNLVVYSSRH